MSIFDSPLLHKSAPSLEAAINAALAMDPGSKKKLHPLRECVLEINVSSARRSIFFGVDNGKIVLLPKSDTPSVRLEGSALALAKLAIYKDKAALFRSKQVCLSGDSVRSEQIQNFMRSIHVDWEGLLAEMIGDVPAHFLGSSVRQSLSWSKMLSQSLLRDIEEFIKYEVRLIPGRAQAEKQFDAIEQLRLATDNLENRFKLLINRAERQFEKKHQERM